MVEKTTPNDKKKVRISEPLTDPTTEQRTESPDALNAESPLDNASNPDDEISQIDDKLSKKNLRIVKKFFRSSDFANSDKAVRNVKSRRDFDYSSIQSDFLNGRIEMVASGKGVVTQEETDTLSSQSDDNFIEYNGYILGGKTFFLFSPENKLRQFAFRMIASKYVSGVLYGIILLNLIMMVVQPNFASRADNWTLYRICDWFDVFGLAAYTIEVVLKILVMGLILGKHTFLRTSVFNVLDFTIVVVGWASIFTEYHFNASVLKGFTALKIMTSMSFLKEMRAIVDAITKAINYIFNVVVFLLFVFVVFGIMGIQFYGRSFSRRCFLITPDGSEQCTLDSGTFACEPAIVDIYCGKEGGMGQSCPGELTCVANTQNPNSGWTHFDHMPGAFLTMFQLITLAGWTDLMYPLMYSENAVLTAGWFLIFIVLGAFIVADLFMAILTALFSSIRAVQEEERQKSLLEKMEIASSTSEEAVRKPMSLVIKDIVLDFPRRFVAVLKQNPFEGTPYLGKVKEFAEAVVQSKFFNIATLLVIFSNLILQSTEYYGMSDTHLYLLNFFTIVYFVVYVIEMALRLIGAKNIYVYITDIFNQLDILLLIVQGFGMVVYAFFDSSDYLHKFGFLRALRLLYVLKMFNFQRTRSLKDLLEKSLKGVVPSLKILVFIGYCIFIFSIVGRQMYGNRLYDEDGETARDNFDTTGYGMLTLFKIMTGDDWTASIYTAMSLAGDGWTAVFYFVIYYLCASFILLNIFTAVVLENFEGEPSEEPDFIISHLIQHDSDNSIIARFQRFLKRVVLYFSTPPKARDELDLYSGDNDLFTSTIPSSKKQKKRTKKEKKGTASLLSSSQKSARQADDVMQDSGVLSPSLSTVANDHFDDTAAAAKISGGAAVLPAAEKSANAFEEDDILQVEKERADAHEHYEETMDIFCFCLPTTHPFRRVIRFIVRNKWFDRVMSFIVVLSAIIMIFEPPSEADLSLEPSPSLTTFLTVCEWIFLVIFIMEFVLKVLSNGLILSRDGTAYFGGDPWNYFDFSLIIIMIFTTALRSVLPSWLRMLRIARSLRPLKVLRQMPGLKTIIADVSRAIPSMLNIMMAAIFIMFLFAVVGVSIFGGKFYSCTDDTVLNKSTCSGYFVNSMGIITHRAWVRPRANFDNVGWSMFTLVEVSSLSDFVSVMWNAMDIVGLDEQPQRDAAPYYSLYFVLYILIGVFFIINIVIAVILDSIDRASSEMSERQQTWVTMKRDIILQGPIRKVPTPKNILRRPFFKLVEWKVRIPSTKQEFSPFNFVVLCGIIVNTIFLCTRHTDQPEFWTSTLEVTNWFFVGFYFVEMIIKLIAYSYYYFFDPWNLFDFVVTWGTLLISVLNIFHWTGTAQLVISFFERIFRVLRVFRLIPSFEGLNMMLNTLFISIPSIINISILMVVLLFIYGLMAQELFGNIKFTTGFHEMASYRSFGVTILTLFRLATLDNWNVLLDNTILVQPFCTLTDEWNDCGSVWAYAYYLTFYVLGAYVFMSLVTGVIVDNFESTFSNIEEHDFHFSNEDMLHFQDVWNAFDPNATGFLPLSKLKDFVLRLYTTRKPGSAFGFDPDENRAIFNIMYYELKHNLEPPTVDEADDNIFERFKVYFENGYQQVKLKRYAVAHKSFRGRVLTYQETLFTMARYSMPNSSLTKAEALKREQALRIAIINDAVLKIEGFYLDFVKYRKRQSKRDISLPADIPAPLAKDVNASAAWEHIAMDDTDSDASSILEEIEEEDLDTMSFIEKRWYNDPPLDVNHLSVQKVYDHMMLHCTLDHYRKSLKQRIDLNCVLPLVKERSLMQIIFNPVYSGIIHMNGFKVQSMDIRKSDAQYDPARSDSDYVSSLIIPLNEVSVFFDESLEENKPSVQKDSPQKPLRQQETFVMYRNEKVSIVSDNFVRTEHVDRYGAQRIKSVFLTHCASSQAIPPEGLYLPDFMDLLHQLQLFDQNHRHELKGMRSLVERTKFVNNHFQYLRPEGVRRFFKSTANKVVKTYRKMQNIEESVEINFHKKDYYKETLDESMLAKNLLLSCATWNMQGANFPDASQLENLIQLQNSDVFALALQECPFTNPEEVVSQMALAIPRRYILLSVSSLYEMHLLVYIRENHLDAIHDIRECVKVASNSSSYQTQGAAGIFFLYHETRIIFLTVALPTDSSAAHASSGVESRNEVIREVLEEMAPKNPSLDVLTEFHHTFVLGSTNYCINLSQDEVSDLRHYKNVKQLVNYDQLSQIRSQGNNVLRLFSEGSINFEPNYHHATSHDTTDAYSDRILWNSQPGFSATCKSYDSVESVTSSEHLPVVGKYILNVLQHETERTPSTRVAINFEFLQVLGLPKNIVIKRPTLEFFSDALTNNGVGSDKTMIASNPFWVNRMLPALRLNTESMEHLQFDHIVVVVFDGSVKDRNGLKSSALKRRRVGRCIIPLNVLCDPDNRDYREDYHFEVPFYTYGGKNSARRVYDSSTSMSKEEQESLNASMIVGSMRGCMSFMKY